MFLGSLVEPLTSSIARPCTRTEGANPHSAHITWLATTANPNVTCPALNGKKGKTNVNCGAESWNRCLCRGLLRVIRGGHAVPPCLVWATRYLGQLNISWPVNGTQWSRAVAAQNAHTLWCHIRHAPDTSPIRHRPGVATTRLANVTRAVLQDTFKIFGFCYTSPWSITGRKFQAKGKASWWVSQWRFRLLALNWDSVQTEHVTYATVRLTWWTRMVLAHCCLNVRLP
jgi:hypothetical protein